MVGILKANVNEVIASKNFIINRVINTAVETGSIADVDKITMHLGDVNGKEIMLISSASTSSVIILNKPKDLDRAIKMISSAIAEERKIKKYS